MKPRDDAREVCRLSLDQLKARGEAAMADLQGVIRSMRDHTADLRRSKRAFREALAPRRRVRTP